MTQTASASNVPTECCGIRCTEQHLCEIDSGKVMVLVPRQDIHRITLRYGIQAPHPIRQAIVGLILMGFGYFPALYFVHWLQHGGVLLGSVMWIVPIVVIGIATVIGVLKHGFYLDIEDQQSFKRLAFRPRPDPAQLEAFLASVERSYGLKISRTG